MPRKKIIAKEQEKPDRGEVLDLMAACEFLKVSKPTFYRWLAQGRIKGFKAGTQWRFYRKDLQQFLESEEPSALVADTDALRDVIEYARKARGLKPKEWPESEEGVVNVAAHTLMADAIEVNASDIHLDHEHEATVVRYRVDGVLQEVMRLPREAALPLVSRFKLMGDMELSERRIPQYGRISIQHQGKDYDLRVTTLPAVFGEAAVLRILDQSSVLIGMDRLGISEAMQAQLKRLAHSPMGIIVAAGPAGCGKTTTLYSMLNEITAPHLKVLTIEDPVEYRIPNATQVHVNRKAGLTTVAAMRSFMHSDPDVIFVGETLEPDILRSCLSAGLTGHLVLTQIYAEDAVQTLVRMMEMEVEPYLLASAVIAVLAQRLARRVCPNCTEPHKPSPDLLRRIEEKTNLDLAKASFAKGKGCEQCRQTGYRGRLGLYEVLELVGPVREAVSRGASADELRRVARESGMVTMLQDGIEKAMQGRTTIDEVLRVLTPI